MRKTKQQQTNKKTHTKNFHVNVVFRSLFSVFLETYTSRRVFCFALNKTCYKLTRHTSKCICCVKLNKTLSLYTSLFEESCLSCHKTELVTYTSLFEVYFLSNKASGAIHLTGKRPCNEKPTSHTIHPRPDNAANNSVEAYKYLAAKKKKEDTNG